MNTEQISITVNGQNYPCLLFRKPIKNLNLRISQTGELRLSVPYGLSRAAILSFLRRQVPFIDRARTRLAARRAAQPAALWLLPGEQIPLLGVPTGISLCRGEQPTAALTGNTLFLTLPDPDDATARLVLFTRFFKAVAEEHLTSAVWRLYPRFAPLPSSCPKLIFRIMKSKWGICRPTAGSITLNDRLFYLPPELSDAVICHEFVHFRHPDHSPAFYRCLSSYVPDCAEKRKALNAFAVPRFATDPDVTENPEVNGKI